MLDAERLMELADRLVNFCHVDTPWEVALGAVAVAAITGDAGSGELVLRGYYSGEEAGAIYDLLEEAASMVEGVRE
jgi:hypothetical protein